MGIHKTKLRGRMSKVPSVRVTQAELAVRGAERVAKEKREISGAEPYSHVWQEAAIEALDTYEAKCRQYGMCRGFDCFNRTKLRFCKLHR